jgi:hypothetical protein
LLSLWKSASRFRTKVRRRGARIIAS